MSGEASLDTAEKFSLANGPGNLGTVAGPTNAQLIVLTKVVFAAVIDDQIRLTPDEIARRTKLTKDVVCYVLRSEAFRTLLEQECRGKVARAISRGIDVVEEILHGEAVTAAERQVKLSAHRALLDTAKTLKDTGPVQDDAYGQQEVMAQIQRLEALAKLKRIDANVKDAQSQ